MADPTPAALQRLAAAMPVIGRHAPGPLDRIADVAGVTVGHCTLAQGDLQTGVTVIRPHGGDPFVDKVPAAAVTINGHCKGAGLLQLDELGLFETPICLTSTLSIGLLSAAQVRAAIAAHPGICRTTTSVNPLVMECSDAYLSDIQQLVLGDAHYAAALADCRADFAVGAVGAGRGMSCFALKGGIGSASRRVRVDARDCTVGVLVLANFGRLHQLIVAGEQVGNALARRWPDGVVRADPQQHGRPETGSIIIVLATDAPVDARQLRRLAMRCTAGLARTGSVFGHGSGDVAIAFSTAYAVRHEQAGPATRTVELLHDERMDPLLFEAAADATEQAILSALYSAETVTGFQGHTRVALREALGALDSAS